MKTTIISSVLALIIIASCSSVKNQQADQAQEESLHVSQADHNISLDWESGSNDSIESFVVFRYDEDDSTHVEESIVSTAAHHLEDHPDHNGTYHYELMSVDEDGMYEIVADATVEYAN